MARVLYGGYEYKIDKKGRIAIPAKLREQLGETFIICRGIYGQRCLCIYSQENWNNLVASIASLPNAKSIPVKRFLYEGAFEVCFDVQGRILIPSSLREYAQLEDEAHIIGIDTKIEIWNKDIWKADQQINTPEAIASIVMDLNF